MHRAVDQFTHTLAQGLVTTMRKIQSQGVHHITLVGADHIAGLRA
jgi:hypothetical protein